MSKRKFSIDYLIKEAGNKTPKEKFVLGKCFKKLESETSEEKKFGLTRHKSKFNIESLKNVEDPEYALFALFEHSIFDAIKSSNEMGYNPDKIGINISSVNLDPDINVSFSRLTANTVPSIYNFFLHIEQSKTKEQSLYGAPFSIEITLSDSSKLSKDKRTLGKGRSIPLVLHNIDPKKLIKVDNPNNSYCLFIALELTRMYVYDYKAINEISHQHFSNVTKKQNRQEFLATELMRKAGIPLNLEEYDAETFCPMIEQYWQKLYPDTFKIFIFDKYGSYRPIYQSDIKKYKCEIVLYHSGDHFDGVKCMKNFFNKCPYYCFWCLSPYDRPLKHQARCKARCFNCTRMGHDFPCPKQDFYKECDECHKEFHNINCYEHHLKIKLCYTYQ